MSATCLGPDVSDSAPAPRRAPGPIASGLPEAARAATSEVNVAGVADDRAYDRHLARLQAVADDAAAIVAELEEAYADDDEYDVTPEQALVGVAADRFGEAGVAAVARIFAGPADAGLVPADRLRRQRARCEMLTRSLLAAVESAGGAEGVLIRARGVLTSFPYRGPAGSARLLGADVAEAVETLLGSAEAAGARG